MEPETKLTPWKLHMIKTKLDNPHFKTRHEVHAEACKTWVILHPKTRSVIYY